MTRGGRGGPGLPLHRAYPTQRQRVTDPVDVTMTTAGQHGEQDGESVAVPDQDHSLREVRPAGQFVKQSAHPAVHLGD